jgi:hypothetical protein
VVDEGVHGSLGWLKDDHARVEEVGCPRPVGVGNSGRIEASRTGLLAQSTVGWRPVISATFIWNSPVARVMSNLERIADTRRSSTNPVVSR